MKVVLNKPKLVRRARNANTASIGGMIVLLGGVVAPMFLPREAQTTSLICILGGLVIAMAGIYQANRWVRKPRPEDQLSRALKGLDDKYVLYHYPVGLPCDHVLITPTGVVNLETVNVAGQFVYQDGRWSERMTIGRALRSVVEERLGDPTKTALAVQRALAEKLSTLTGTAVAVKPLIVFTHPQAELELEPGGPVPVYKIDKIKKQVSLEGPRLSEEAYERIAGFLEKAVLG